jgi:hypothetical protein
VRPEPLEGALELAGLLQARDGELPDHAQQREAGFAEMRRPVDDALVDQRGEQVDDVGYARHGFRRLDREAAGEDAETPEQPLLLGRKELVAPRDRRLERALSRRSVARPLE